MKETKRDEKKHIRNSLTLRFVRTAGPGTSYIGKETTTSCVDVAGAYSLANPQARKENTMTYEEMFKKAEKEKALKDLTPIFKEFRKKGEKIIGQFISCSDVDSSTGEGTYKHYLFDTDEGLVKFSLGAATDKEVLGLMGLDDIFVVEFINTIKISGGRSVNKFKVQQIITDLEQVGGEDDEIPDNEGGS